MAEVKDIEAYVTEQNENAGKPQEGTQKRWYLTRFSRITISDLRSQLDKAGLEYFLPTKPVTDNRRKEDHTVVEQSSMFNMLFIHSKLNEAANFIYAEPKVNFMFTQRKEYVTPLYRVADTVSIKQRLDEEAKKNGIVDDNHFNMLCDESSFKYVVVIPDNQMVMFMKAITYADNSLRPFLKPSEIDFEKGDRVRIIGGKLHGVEGILEGKKGKDGGHVIVNLCNFVAVRTADVKPEYIQIIEFAKDGKHIYKKFDSFMTRGGRCIQNLMEKKDQDTKDLEYLLNFTRRFENLQPDTINMKAKLLLFMFVSYACIGDLERKKIFEKKLYDFLPEINSDIMKATCALNLYRCTGSKHYQSRIKSIIEDWKNLDPSKSKGDKKRDGIREAFNAAVEIL